MSVLVIPNTFVGGTVIASAPMNANFSATASAVNSIDNTNIGVLGIFPSQIKPTTAIQGIFGGSATYSFVAPSPGITPLVVQGATAQQVDIFSGFYISAGISVKSFAMISTGQYYGAVALTPQITQFTSGSGTYTTPTNRGILAAYLVVELVGGGAGGVGAGNGGSGTAGTNTTFGGFLTGNGAPTVGGSGSAGLGGTASGGNVNITGGDGAGGDAANAGIGVQVVGGVGGASYFGGGAGSSGGGPGNNARAYGSGGGGGGNGGGASVFGGGGGGAGGYCRAIVPTPNATYAFSVGGGGTGTIGIGTGSGSGGNGAPGVIIVTAYWQ